MFCVSSKGQRSAQEEEELGDFPQTPLNLRTHVGAGGAGNTGESSRQHPKHYS